MKKIVITVLLCLIVGALVYTTIFGNRGVIHLTALQTEINDLQLKNKQLAIENNELRTEVHLLRNDVQYLENIARKELGLIKDNEVVYHIKNN